MKFSIAVDLRKRRDQERSAAPSLATALKRQEANGVKVIRLYGKGRYASVEAPEAAFEALQSAVGDAFVVSPAFAMDTLGR